MFTEWKTETIPINSGDVVFAIINYNSIYYGIGYSQTNDINFIIKNINTTTLEYYSTNLIGAFFCVFNFTYAQNKNILIASSINDNSQVLYLDLNDTNLQWTSKVYDNLKNDLFCQSVTFFQYNSTNIFFINAKNMNESNFYYSINNGQTWNKINTIHYNDQLVQTSCYQMAFFENKLLCTSIENSQLIYGEFSGSFNTNTITLNFYKTNIIFPEFQSKPGIFLNTINNKFIVYGSFTNNYNNYYFFCLFCNSDFSYTSLSSNITVDQIYGGDVISTNNSNDYVLFVNFDQGLIKVHSESYEVISELNFSTFCTTINDNVIAVSGYNETSTFSTSNYIPSSVCLLDNCFILLSIGTYKAISLLTEKDKILGFFSKKEESILKIQKHTHVIKNIPFENRPYLISKHSFGKNIPNKDINVSGYHRIILEKEKDHFIGIQTFKIPSCTLDSSFKTDDIVIYYHVKLINQNEALIVNNLPLESLQN